MSRRKISRSLIAGLFTGLGSIGAFAFGLAVVMPGGYFPEAIRGSSEELPTHQVETAETEESFSPFTPNSFAVNFERDRLPEANRSPEQSRDPGEGLADGSGSGQLPGNAPVEDGDTVSPGNAADSPGAHAEGGDSDGSFAAFASFGFSRHGLAQGSFADGGTNEDESPPITGLDTPLMSPDGITAGPLDDASGLGDDPSITESAEAPPSVLPADGEGHPPSMPASGEGPFFFSPAGFPIPPASERSDNPSPPQDGEPQPSNPPAVSAPVTETGPESPSSPALPSSVREVPEPGSLVLVGLGLLGIRSFHRKGRP